MIVRTLERTRLAVQILELQTEGTFPQPGTAIAFDDTTVDALRLRYALAAAHTHLAIKLLSDLSAEATRHLEPARTGARNAADDGTKFTEQAGGARSVAVSHTALAFLTESLVPACRLLGWGVELYLYGLQESADEVAQARATRTKVVQLASTKVSYRVRYNLACYWSTWLDQFPNDADPVETWTPAEWGVDELAKALQYAPRPMARRFAAWACADPSMASLRSADPAAFAQALETYR